ncbi:Spermidine N(1)-acetyltransferase [compost metagenome]
MKTVPKTETTSLDFSFSGSDFEVLNDRKQDSISDEGWFRYCLKNKANDDIIGNCAFKLKQNNQHIAEIEVSISPIQQRKGYAKETASAIISFLFKNAKVNRIVKTVNAKNETAIGLLRSLGFREEGYFIENILVDGKWINEYQFALLKSEWDLMN